MLANPNPLARLLTNLSIMLLVAVSPLVGQAAEGQIVVTTNKQTYTLGEIVTGTASVTDLGGYGGYGPGSGNSDLDGVITVSTSPALTQNAPPVVQARSTSFSFKADQSGSVVITGTSYNSNVSPGSTSITITSSLKITASTNVVDFGSITLGNIDISQLKPIQVRFDNLSTEMSSFANDGEITPAERVRIPIIQTELTVLRARIRAIVFAPTPGTGRNAGSPVTLSVTGNSGDHVTLTLSEEFVSCKFGTGYGSTLGTLSAITGVIPFSVTFAPSGNYGTATVKATLDSNSSATDSTALTLKGQSEESARAAETTRFDKINDALDDWSTQMANIAAFGGIATGATIAALSAIAGVFLIFTVIAIALLFAAIALVAAIKVREAKRLNRTVHTLNLSIIELLPEVNPEGGTENDN